MSITWLVTWPYSHFNNFLPSFIIILFLSLATQVPASLLYHQASLATLSKSPTRSTQKGVPKRSFKVRSLSSNLLAQGKESTGSMAVCIPSNQDTSEIKQRQNGYMYWHQLTLSSASSYGASGANILRMSARQQAAWALTSLSLCLSINGFTREAATSLYFDSPSTWSAFESSWARFCE